MFCGFLVQFIFVKNNVYAVMSGLQMVIVDDLMERLVLGLLLNLLLGYAFCHNPWVPINTSDQSMAKGFIRSAFIIGLDNDCLASSKSAGKYKDNLALFHNLAHFSGCGTIFCCYTAGKSKGKGRYQRDKQKERYFRKDF